MKALALPRLLFATRRAAFAGFLVLGFVLPASASSQPPMRGIVEGVVSTQAGSVRLPGVTVRVRDSAGRETCEGLSDGEGRFVIEGVPDGSYRVMASLDGFDTVDAPVVVTAGRANAVSLDLPISAIAEKVEVVASPAVVSAGETLSTRTEVSGKEVEESVSRGDGFQAALRLLVSVIEVPGGLSIKGGRPGQATTQIGSATIIDPSTGLVHLTLPADAIDSVSVMPNPYAVEFGRFSSGLVVIQTRRAGDLWKTRLGNVDPSLRMDRDQQWKVIGLESIGPRVETGGPLVKGKLFLEEAAQYRYDSGEVMSRPQDEHRTTQWFSSFTRVDANLSPRHFLTGTVGLFPSTRSRATLGTFTPPDATVDLNDRVTHVSLVERSLWTDSLIVESMAQLHGYRTQVAPQGTAPMELRPETTLGNFYNQQRRTTSTMQWIETLTGSKNALGSLHIFKVGVDVLRNEYDGTSSSQPALIESSSGRLVRRLDYSRSTAQALDTTDVALFAQDRMQPTSRWYVEFGGRLDRDGVVEQVNLTPRIGSAVLLNEAGTSVVRGGYGLFFERTPSIAGAFGEFGSALDTRYAADGVTPVSTILFSHQVGDVSTPRSATWDLAFDHKLNKEWSLHLGFLDRSGSHELIVDPIVTPGGGAWLLHSAGRSSYREVEASARYSRPTADFNVSYVRSIARGDLNELNAFFDTVMRPVIGTNQYAPANADVPHRVFVRGRVNPTPIWLLTGVFDWHIGVPYSLVNESLDYVLPRNSERFPNQLRLDVGFERKFNALKWRPWIGFRIYNALNSFIPLDVQSNVSSPAFGSFYNSEIRQIRLQLRFDR